MPGISFDKSGISNFSKNFIKLEKQPLVKLENTLNLHRSSTQKTRYYSWIFRRKRFELHASSFKK